MDDAAFPSHSALLATALRAIRRARGMRSSEVAEAMGLQLRTYQHFEEGAGPFDLDRIRRFADATDSDPTNNSCTWTNPVLASYDPNDKLVHPATATDKSSRR